VTKVYRSALGREPDRMGRAHYLLELRSGLSDKIKILDDIRFSPEGKAKLTQVKGLLWPYSWKLLRRSLRFAQHTAGLIREQFRSAFELVQHRLHSTEERFLSLEGRLSTLEIGWRKHIPASSSERSKR
jgi:Domain of unknown function (DUF4214)